MHLEVTNELSATTFLLAFRHFYSQKGIPTVIFSDNARTFKHSKEIKIVIRTEEVQLYLTNQQIIWNFIIERAPGGWGLLGATRQRSEKLL